MNAKRKGLLTAVLTLALLAALPGHAHAAAGSDTANAVELEFDTPYSRTITSKNCQNPYFIHFTLPDDGVITITFDRASTPDGKALDYEFSLYSAADLDTPCWQSDTADSCSAAAPDLSLSVGLAAGDYYLNADPDLYYLSEEIETNYTISFQADDYCERESNNNALDATSAETGETYHGYIDGGADCAEYWSFHVSGDCLMRVYIPQFQTLYPADATYGVKPAFTDSLGTSYEWIDLDGKLDENGQYYFEVNASGGINTFSLTNQYGYTVQLPYSICFEVISCGDDGHNYGLKEITTEATCTTDGSFLMECTICGDSYTEAIPATGHDLSSYDILAPTCSITGKRSWVCSECGYSYTEELPTNNDHSLYPQEVKATCLNRGYTYDYCYDCQSAFNLVYTDEVLPHTPIVINESAATCTKEGYSGDEICLYCNTVLTPGQILKPLGHTWGEWTLLAAATQTHTGLREHRCGTCGITAQEELPALSATVNPFTDVNETDYFYDCVLWAYSSGVTSGTTDTTFSPGSPCTRAQVVTFLWSAMGKPKTEAAESPFVDVKSTDYYYQAVLWAVKNGITAGTDDTHFSPDAVCTRAQVVTFLWATSGRPKVATTVLSFHDVPEGEYYYHAVLWAAESGITSGTTATTFSPDAKCTRGQIVTFLYGAMA